MPLILSNQFQTETHWTQIKTDERQVSQKMKSYFQKESIFSSDFDHL